MSLGAYIGWTFRMDPVEALKGGRVAVALRVAAADFIVSQLPGAKNSPQYADGMPEA